LSCKIPSFYILLVNLQSLNLVYSISYGKKDMLTLMQRNIMISVIYMGISSNKITLHDYYKCKNKLQFLFL